ncbi:trimeric intracellular cation channel family protein [bacterium]|nr:MAG: trimeric intracellular cation channel family protein [bacterium]
MILDIIDILGLITFAISGVLTAQSKKMDIFGIFTIAFVTSVGGGTLRDVLIGTTPVGWMNNLIYVYTIMGSVIFALMFNKILSYLRTSFFLFDTIGIGLYTVYGVQKGLSLGLHPVICIFLGTISASFGGVIRDILCNEIPIIFRQEIYATACIFGGIVYFGLEALHLEHNLVLILSVLSVISVRIIAVKYKLSFPAFY